MGRKHFHMPVRRGAIHGEAVREAVRDLVDARYRVGQGPEAGVVVGVRTDFAVHHEDVYNVVQSASITLLVERDDPLRGMSQARTRELPEAGIAAMGRLALDLAEDWVATMEVSHRLSSLGHAVSDFALGRLFSCLQGRDFALFGCEYPQTAMTSMRMHPFGPGPGPVDPWREAMMTLLLPEPESAHAEVAERMAHPRIAHLAKLAWNHHGDGIHLDHPLADVDFGAIA